MSAKKKVPYGEGDWFAVPLQQGTGFGVGLICACDGKGGVVGYFFDAQYGQVPSLDDVADLGQGDVLLVRQFGDLGLIRDEWPVIGPMAGFDRESWPLPDFGWREELRGGRFRITRPRENLASKARQERISEEEFSSLPYDILSGAGAVEIALTKLLAGHSVWSQKPERRPGPGR